MKRYILLFVLSVIFPLCALSAGDGAIVGRQTVTFPESSDVELQSITYMSDDLRVKGYIAFPKNEGHYPCVIYNRGGNREFSAWTDESAIRNLGKIASWGCVVVASQYRGNGGGEGKEEFSGTDVNDVLNLLPLLAIL